MQKNIIYLFACCSSAYQAQLKPQITFFYFYKYSSYLFHLTSLQRNIQDIRSIRIQRQILKPKIIVKHISIKTEQNTGTKNWKMRSQRMRFVRCLLMQNSQFCFLSILYFQSFTIIFGVKRAIVNFDTFSSNKVHVIHRNIRYTFLKHRRIFQTYYFMSHYVAPKIYVRGKIKNMRYKRIFIKSINLKHIQKKLYKNYFFFTYRSSKRIKIN